MMRSRIIADGEIGARDQAHEAAQAEVARDGMRGAPARLHELVGKRNLAFVADRQDARAFACQDPPDGGEAGHWPAAARVAGTRMQQHETA